MGAWWVGSGCSSYHRARGLTFSPRDALLVQAVNILVRLLLTMVTAITGHPVDPLSTMIAATDIVVGKLSTVKTAIVIDVMRLTCWVLRWPPSGMTSWLAPRVL